MSSIEPKRIALVITVFASNILFTGLVFGWAPLLLMLQNEKQYGELCENDTALIHNSDSDDLGFACAAQENKLNLIFVVASVIMSAVSLPVGIFMDYAGPMKAIALAAVVELSGLFLMAFADSQTFDIFIPAYTMLALGGIVTMMASYPASFVIVEYQTMILAGINCLFDGSSVVFLIFYSMQSTFGTSRQQLFIGLAFLAGLIYLLLIALWYLNEKGISLKRNASDSAIVAKEESQESRERLNPEAQVKTLSKECNGNAHDPFVDSVPLDQLKHKLDTLRLVDAPIRRQLKSMEFTFIMVFAMIQMLRATIYIGTTNKLLENYGDADHSFIYTKVFSMVLPLGFLFVPAIDYIVERKGLMTALLVTIGLGVTYNVFSLIPSLPVQCFSFFFFTSFRAFLYAVMSVFMAKTFGVKNLGTLMGFIFSIGSVVGFLEYPAVLVSNKYLDGELTLMYVISLFLCVTLIPFVSYLRNCQHTRKQRQQELVSRLEGMSTWKYRGI